MAILVLSVSLRFERWFPHAVSTKSWAGRAAIGWNIFLCELESMNFKKYIKHRRGGTSRMFFFIGLVYFAILGFESVFILWLTPFVSIAFAYSWSDDMRLLADQTAKTDPRVAALIY
jgi:hypothetical protein